MKHYDPSNRKEITVGNLTFKWSSVIEGYYADVGSQQLQLLSEDDGIHWYFQLFDDTQTISHNPEDTATVGYNLIKELASII